MKFDSTTAPHSLNKSMRKTNKLRKRQYQENESTDYLEQVPGHHTASPPIHSHTKRKWPEEKHI